MRRYSRAAHGIVAALRTGIVKNCLHAAHLEYQWNGQGIEAVFEVNQVL